MEVKGKRLARAAPRPTPPKQASAAKAGRCRLKEAIAKMRLDGQELGTRQGQADEWAKGHEVHIHQVLFL